MSRYIRTVRYASRTTGVNFEKWLTWGAIGVGAYLLLKAFSFVSATGEALASAGAAIGSGLYDFLHPDEMGESKFYTVNFPDGSRHSVPGGAVNSNGIFRNLNLTPTYAGDGKTYRIVVDKSNRGKMYAVPA